MDSFIQTTKPQICSSLAPQRSIRTRARPSSTSQVPLGSTGLPALLGPIKTIWHTARTVRTAIRETNFICFISRSSRQKCAGVRSPRAAVALEVPYAINQTISYYYRLPSRDASGYARYRATKIAPRAAGRIGPGDAQGIPRRKDLDECHQDQGEQKRPTTQRPAYQGTGRADHRAHRRGRDKAVPGIELRVDQRRSDRGDGADLEADLLRPLRFQRRAICRRDPTIGR